MSLGVGAYKVGGAGQCSSIRRRYPWQPCKWPPTQPESPLVLENGGASEQGWNGTSDSNNPKHQAQQLHQKTDNTITKWMQLTVRTTPKTAVQTQGNSVLNSTAMSKELWITNGKDTPCKGQLTRDARNSFRRCADVKLVCIASPTSKNLN